MGAAQDQEENARRIVDAALRLSEPERSGFVARSCPDLETRIRVLESLLERVIGAGAHPGASAAASTPSEDVTIDGDLHDTLATNLDGNGLDRIGRASSQLAEDPSGASPAIEGGGAAQAFRLGAFRILRTIGSGGMGTVFEAHDDRLGRRVAIKSIRAPHRLDPLVKARFLREARMLSSLEHPNLCRLYDYLETPAGEFLILEYIDGEPLGLASKRRSKSARLEIAEQVARVLVAAHAAGIIHRDLKPDNVLVTADGVAKVLDFGLARRALDDDPEHPPSPQSNHAPKWDAALLTSPGDILGTPMYMSPEQARGQEPTSASDMYAFGLLLQELFSGERPFERGQGVEHLLERVARGARRRPRLGDRALERLIDELTTTDPGQRPGASEAAHRLARLRGRPARRLLLGAAITVALLAIAGTVKYTIDLRQERSTAWQARNDAEDLVGFMTEELRDRLAPVGRLDALGAVAERVIDYYAGREPTTLDDAQRHKYAKGLKLIGEVQLIRTDADLDSARRAFVDAASLLTPLAESDPSNGPVLKSLGAVHFWLGSIAYRQGDLVEAQHRFELYHDLALRLVGLDDGNPEWQLELAYAQSNLVHLFRDRGALEQSRRYLDASLTTKRRLVELAPGDAEARRSLANGLTYLAQQRQASGELEGAIDAVSESVELLDPASDRLGADTEEGYRLAVVLVHRGELLQAAGRHDGALRDFRRAQSILRSLLAIEPGNGDWQRELAIVHRHCGRSLLRLDRLADARLEHLAGRRLLEELLAADPRQLRWTLDLATSEQIHAELEAAGNALEQALALFQQARARLESATSEDGGFQLEQSTRTAALLLAEGRVHERRGETGPAEAAWAEAAVRLDQEDAAVPARRHARALMRTEALLRLGRRDEAEALIRAQETERGTPIELPAELRDLLAEGRHEAPSR